MVFYINVNFWVTLIALKWASSNLHFDKKEISFNAWKILEKWIIDKQKDVMWSW